MKGNRVQTVEQDEADELDLEDDDDGEKCGKRETRVRDTSIVMEKKTNWQDPVSRRRTGSDGASCPQASSRCCEHVPVSILTLL